MFGFAITSRNGSSSATLRPYLENITIKVRKPIMPISKTMRNFFCTDVESFFIAPRFPVSLDLKKTSQSLSHRITTARYKYFCKSNILTALHKCFNYKWPASWKEVSLLKWCWAIMISWPNVLTMTSNVYKLITWTEICIQSFHNLHMLHIFGWLHENIIFDFFD